MEKPINTTTATERKGMALSGFIMSLIALVCAFFPGWRMFGVVIALAGLLVSFYSLRRARKVRKPRGLALPGALVSIFALLICGYFLYVKPAQEEKEKEKEEIPSELRDSSSMEDQDRSADQLKNIIDTSQSH